MDAINQRVVYKTHQTEKDIIGDATASTQPPINIGAVVDVKGNINNTIKNGSVPELKPGGIPHPKEVVKFLDEELQTKKAELATCDLLDNLPVVVGQIQLSDDEQKAIMTITNTSQFREEVKETVKASLLLNPKLDITHLSSSIVALLVEAINLWSDLQKSQSELQSGFMKLNKSLSDSVGNAIIKAGFYEMLGPMISGGMQAIISGVAAKQQLNGLSAERQSLKTHGPVVSSLEDKIDIGKTKIKDLTASLKEANITPTNRDTLIAQKTKLEEEMAELKSAKVTHNDEKNKIDQQAKSKAIMAEILKGVVGSTVPGFASQWTGEVKAEENALQNTQNAQSKATDAAEQDLRAQLQKLVELIADCLRKIQDTTSSHSNAFSAFKA